MRTLKCIIDDKTNKVSVTWPEIWPQQNINYQAVVRSIPIFIIKFVYSQLPRDDIVSKIKPLLQSMNVKNHDLRWASCC